MAEEGSRVQREEEVQILRRRVASLESERRETETMLRSLVESVPDLIYRLDRDGRIIFINEAIRRYGYAPEELVGTSILDLIHPEDREKAHYRINERRTGQRSTRSLEVRMLTRDHDPVTFEFKGSSTEVEPTIEVSAAGVYASEQPRSEHFVCTQGVARDVSERRRMEEVLRQAERDRVLTETAGAAAHEINQPLTVIVASLEMMLMELDPGSGEADNREELERLLAEARRIDGIVKKMLRAHHYISKPYVEGTDIADFDASSQDHS